MHLQSIPGHAPLRLKMLLNKFNKLHEDLLIARVLLIFIVEHLPENIAGIIEKGLQQRFYRVFAEAVCGFTDLLSDKEIKAEDAACLLTVHAEDRMEPGEEKDGRKVVHASKHFLDILWRHEYHSALAIGA